MLDQDALNMQIRKFLKQVGVTSQREIEQALQQALADGRIQGGEQLKLRMTLEVDELSLRHTVDGGLDLGAS
ncbi:DUF6494 family protein [Methylonatrum kenyense]|uniref:DUF6494 family protein n=1 Tax=Methylonatrum kenyense TaxID=455253 RepID=UPI0020BFCED0|nr:DUF6494 family protein [Methylonatrum kenyense]MCK8514812.1 DUF6494 family protein [Methylonatrum kenyense]